MSRDGAARSSARIDVCRRATSGAFRRWRWLAPVLCAFVVATALAQAPATAIAPDATFLFELLGSANAITIRVPEEVREVLVLGQHRGEVHVTVDTTIDVDGAPRQVNILAGGVTAVGRCAATAFARIEVADEDGRPRGGTMNARCFGDEDDLQFAKLHSGTPLFFLGIEAELPLDTWLAFEAMRVGSGIIEAPDDAFVFYVYLDTSDIRGGAGTPVYDSWTAVARAFEPQD